MKLLIVEIDHYPNFDMLKIFHGCGIRKKSNWFNELIDRANDGICSSSVHMTYWKFCDTKKDKMCNKRYVTCRFLKELAEKGLLISYKSILHLDEQKRTT